MYGVKYIIDTQSIIDNSWRIDIEEKDYSGTTTTFLGSGTPIRIKYTNNGEEKFSPIAASEAIIQFVDDDFLLENIIDPDDKKYRISIYQDDVLQWRGLLATDDCNELYQSGYRVFELVAVDGLGLLKNYEATLDYGYYSLLDVIRHCLTSTETELKIFVECRVSADNMSNLEANNPFDQCRVHSKLFNYTDGGPVTLYEILETIMSSFFCTLFQHGGRWVIRRMPDMVYGSTLQGRDYDWPGPTGTDLLLSYEFTRFTDFIPINAGHRLSFIKPSATSTVKHNYLLPDVPINSDLTEGDRWPEMDSTNKLAYRINLWNYESGAVTAPTILNTAYRIEEYDADGNLSGGYVVLPDGGTNDERLLNMDGVYVEQGDKFSFSAETRLDQDLAGSGTGVALRIRLVGDSGQHYTWDETNGWTATLTSAIGSSAYTRTYAAGDDLTEWVSFNVNCDGFPEGGYFQVFISEWSTGVRESWFKGVTQSLQLYLGQSLGTLQGEQSVSSNTTVSNKDSERLIKLGQTPKRTYASTLFEIFTITLTTNWNRYGEALTGQRLIDINSDIWHEQQNRVFKKLEGDYKGVRMSAQDYKLVNPGCVFYFNDASTVYWIPVSLDIDPVNDQFSCVLVEHKDSSKTTDTEATNFKYLFNERN